MEGRGWQSIIDSEAAPGSAPDGSASVVLSAPLNRERSCASLSYDANGDQLASWESDGEVPSTPPPPPLASRPSLLLHSALRLADARNATGMPPLAVWGRWEDDTINVARIMDLGGGSAKHASYTCSGWPAHPKGCASPARISQRTLL